MVRNKIYALLPLFLIVFSNCIIQPETVDNVEIRIENRTGKTIKNLWLGSNAYNKTKTSRIEYSTTYHNINTHTTTEYKNIKGGLTGYRKGNLIFEDQSRAFLRARDIEKAMQQVSAYLKNETIKESKSGKEYTYQLLKDGKYTFALENDPVSSGYEDLSIKIIPN